MEFWIWCLNGYDYRASPGDQMAGDDIVEWLQSSDHQQLVPGGQSHGRRGGQGHRQGGVGRQGGQGPHWQDKTTTEQPTQYNQTFNKHAQKTILE